MRPPHARHRDGGTATAAAAAASRATADAAATDVASAGDDAAATASAAAARVSGDGATAAATTTAATARDARASTAGPAGHAAPDGPPAGAAAASSAVIVSRLRRSTKSETWRLRPARAVLGLSDEWRRWLASNAIDGCDRQELVTELVGHGVPILVAAREVDAALASAATEVARRWRTRAMRAESVLDMRARLELDRPIERRTMPTAAEFFDRYYSANRPVVLTDATRDWPARTRWTPGALKERFGAVEIEVALGRDPDPKCDANLDKYRTHMTLGEYVDRVLAAGETNDLYSVSNNRNMDRPELAALWDDVHVDETFFEPRSRDRAGSIWIGPRGTITRMHHDTTNILFCQFHGRKRVTLISPVRKAMLASLSGYYSDRPTQELLADPEVDAHVVDLSPGDALFLPVGWWHEVRALDVSVSFSLVNFRRPNDFSEYQPGNH